MTDRSTEIKNSLNQKLIETGEKERLKDMLRQRLTECGWRDELKEHAKDIVRQRGLQQITVDDLVKEITPQGRDLVPDTVKRELLAEIKKFLASQAQ
ncbi:transcription and mRNA export factor ENY2-like [Macrobrachium rosenbergii]|uniref:transcription and mRNA export factor ENY2-like n=1 Tax=Macrobrachium rosenbergii TaxID=79674 RepID=UPI0034D5A60D